MKGFEEKDYHSLHKEYREFLSQEPKNFKQYDKQAYIVDLYSRALGIFKDLLNKKNDPLFDKENAKAMIRLLKHQIESRKKDNYGEVLHT